VSVSTTISAASVTAGSLVYTLLLRMQLVPQCHYLYFPGYMMMVGLANGGVDLDPTTEYDQYQRDFQSMTHLPVPIKRLLPMRMWPILFVAADFGFTDAFDTPPNNFLSVSSESGRSAGSLTHQWGPGECKYYHKCC
jgi:hypothetical protein